MSFLDQFAKEVNFTYNRQPFYKTCCGGFVSICVFVILGFYFAYLLNIMISREFPDTIERTIFADEGPTPLNILYDPEYDDPNVQKYTIPNQNRTTESYFYSSISFRLSDNSFGVIDPSVIRFSVNQVDLVNGTFITTPKNYEPCTKFGDFKLSDFDYLPLNSTYCINDNFTLAGFYGKEGSSFLEIRVGVCNNSPNCLPADKIASTIKGAKIEFYYQSSVLNATATENILSTTLEQTYWDIVPTFTKLSNIEVGIDTLESYDGYLPDFIWDRKYYTYTLAVRSINTILSDGNKNKDFLIIRISNSRISKLTERRFIDFITQLGKLGGIIGLPVMFGTLFVFLFANFDFKVNMTNVFYNLIDPANTKNVSKKFDSFIQAHYNNLMLEYEKLRQRPEKEMELKNINPLELKGVEQSEDLYETKLNYMMKSNPDVSNFEKFFTISKIERMFGLSPHERKEKLEQFKNNNFKLDDTYSLLGADPNQNDNKSENKDIESNNILEEQLTFRKSSSEVIAGESEVEKITREKAEMVDFDKMMKENKKIIKRQNSRRAKKKVQKYEKDFYTFILTGKDKTMDYYKYSILYQVFKYINYDKLLLKPHEIVLKLFCGCCIKRRSIQEIKDNFYKKGLNLEDEGTDLIKRCDILDTASERMTIDFDLAYILKSVDDFEKFIVILFTKEQYDIYKSIAKPNITLIPNPGELKLIDALEKVDGHESERDRKNMLQFEAFLDIMSKKELEAIDIKLMRIMGLSFEEAYNFGEAVRKNIRMKKDTMPELKEIIDEDMDPNPHKKETETETIDPLLDDNGPEVNGEPISEKDALDRIHKQFNQ
jgi:hypothetical protein